MTTRRKRALAAGLALGVIAAASPAMAQDLNTFGSNILAELNSTFLQAIAACAIIGVSLMWMFGHMRLGMAFTIGLGITAAATSASIASKFFGA